LTIAIAGDRQAVDELLPPVQKLGVPESRVLPARGCHRFDEVTKHCPYFIWKWMTLTTSMDKKDEFGYLDYTVGSGNRGRKSRVLEGKQQYQ